MKKNPQHKWFALGLLALAQFIMVLDGTVMNVSISQIVVDLNTSVTGLQAAITFFTLTMAAFMLTGSRLGSKWGARKAFAIGLAIYGIGSFVTGASQGLISLMVGWSFIEGIGAVLVIPAIIALIAINYSGKDRVIAFSVIGAASGIAAAFGPLIGGVMTTYFSWRYVFFGETIAVVALLFLLKNLASEKVTKKVEIEMRSVCYSALGMGLLVLGLLQGKTWGWITPIKVPEILGVPVAPLGTSLAAYCIFFGILFLTLFYQRQDRMIKNNKEPFLDVRLFQIPALRAGLSALLFQYLSVAAIFFVIPIYLQIILGYNALETGLKIIPLSIGIIIFSVLGTKLLAKYSVRYLVRAGQGGLIIGTLIILASLSLEFQPVIFALGLLLVGAGLGFLSSQIGNVNMSAVPQDKSDEVGGLQGTFQNLGSSLGTAVIGSVLIISLTSSFMVEVNNSASIPDSVKVYLSEQQGGVVPIVSGAQVEEYALEQGVSGESARIISQIYTDAQMQGLEKALVFLLGLTVLSMLFSRNIPLKN